MRFISKKLYKSLKKEQKEIDFLMWLVGIFSPLGGVPQVVLIYMNQSSMNLSFLTWFFWTIMAVIYLLYGIIHRIRPLIISNIIWIIVYIFILAGIAIYS